MTFLMLLLPLLCAACSDAASNQAGLSSRTETGQSPSAAVNHAPEYATDAQRTTGCLRTYFRRMPAWSIPSRAVLQPTTSRCRTASHKAYAYPGGRAQVVDSDAEKARRLFDVSNPESCAPGRRPEPPGKHPQQGITSGFSS
jgi:hypothetical protein